ncbi:hypothetical protein NN561_005882 [Cricetulus griseus]
MRRFSQNSGKLQRLLVTLATGKPGSPTEAAAATRPLQAETGNASPGLGNRFQVPPAPGRGETARDAPGARTCQRPRRESFPRLVRWSPGLKRLAVPVPNFHHRAPVRAAGLACKVPIAFPDRTDVHRQHAPVQCDCACACAQDAHLDLTLARRVRPPPRDAHLDLTLALPASDVRPPPRDAHLDLTLARPASDWEQVLNAAAGRGLSLR